MNKDQTCLLIFSGEEKFLRISLFDFHCGFCIAKVIKNKLESHTLKQLVWLIVDCPRNADILKFYTEHI